MYRFSSKWADHDVQGVKGKFVCGEYATESEEEAVILRRNKDIIELTKVLDSIKETENKEPVVLKVAPAEAEVNVPQVVIEPEKPAEEEPKGKRGRPRIVVGTRTVQEKEQ